ncbi:MAG TPA: DtxR family transcriptional regulator, partial [Lachnospiraceae bacterium]|nr:DtxR family transcriptional regulator [Lachnospiraceae bacterium]
CRIEHIIDDDTFDKLKAYYNSRMAEKN